MDATLPDEAVGASVGRLAIDGIEFGRQELTKKKVVFETPPIVERIERWIAGTEWLDLIVQPNAADAVSAAGKSTPVCEATITPPRAESSDRLEIHVPGAAVPCT